MVIVNISSLIFLFIVYPQVKGKDTPVILFSLIPHKSNKFESKLKLQCIS